MSTASEWQDAEARARAADPGPGHQLTQRPPRPEMLASVSGAQFASSSSSARRTTIGWRSTAPLAPGAESGERVDAAAPSS